jgi:hypothetical protein
MPSVISGDANVSATEFGYLDGVTSALQTQMDAKLNVAGGKVLQIVSTAKTDTFSTSSTSFVDVTGLSVTITPSSATSKILIFADVKIGNATAVGAFVRLMRDSTAIYIGDAAGSRTRATYSTADDPSSQWIYQGAGIFLDSPATTGATVYKIQMSSEASPNTGTVYINSSGEDLTTADFARTASSITVMEVSA